MTNKPPQHSVHAEDIRAAVERLNKLLAEKHDARYRPHITVRISGANQRAVLAWPPPESGLLEVQSVSFEPKPEVVWRKDGEG